MNQIVTISGVTNREFLETHARPGRVGLAGGETLIDKAIRRAQRHVDAEKRWGLWSHAFLFEGQRADGYDWVIESDLEIARKHIRLGVQENRITKFFDDSYYSSLAVLDFALTPEQVAGVVREGLELVAGHARYSLRELLGTVFALRHPSLRGHDNLLARKQSMYCSAFVQHLFRQAGIDLAPGIHDKNTTPEDIWRSLAPHTAYLLERQPAASAKPSLAARLRRRIASRREKRASNR